MYRRTENHLRNWIFILHNDTYIAYMDITIALPLEPLREPSRITMTTIAILSILINDNGHHNNDNKAAKNVKKNKKKRRIESSALARVYSTHI